MSKNLGIDVDLICAESMEKYVQLFDRPELRLRFINRAREVQSLSIDRFRKSIWPFSFIERTRIYRCLLKQVIKANIYKLLIEELGIPELGKLREPTLVRPPRMATLLQRLYHWRFMPYSVSFLILLIMTSALISIANWSTRYFYVSADNQKTPVPVLLPVQNTAYASIDTKHLPGYRPERIWLVEREENHEQYSNGVRVLTRYETDNQPRNYYVGKRRGDITKDEIHHEPIGILFHSSESDLLPFTNENNKNINNKTHALLKYIKEKKLYNYVIDRFGQIYRIVKDEHTAYHAGHSIWADDKNVYVELNESFIGVCFESNSISGQSMDDRLTEAQIISGRLLTAVLRSRYRIDDTNCVTHGLVSVNPSNMLIGYHHDWISNFPFEALGLTDKYKVPLPSVSEFGFGYDDFIVKKLGGAVWLGVSLGETAFGKRAASENFDIEEFRRKERARYKNYLNVVRNSRLAKNEDHTKQY
jgi:hypothetical protein